MFWGWLISVTVLSLIPGGSIEGVDVEIPHLDKVVHFLFYSGLAFLLSKYLSSYSEREKKDRKKWKGTSGIALICIIYGILMEVFQELLIPGRHFEYWDIFFNIAGVFAGIVIFKLADKKR